MFIRNKSNYLVTVRLNLGNLLACASDDEAYIELKEMNTMDVMNLKNSTEQGDEVYMQFMKDLLPSIIVSHNLYRDEKELMSNLEVAELIYSKIELTNFVISEYSKSTFRVSNGGSAEADKKSS